MAQLGAAGQIGDPVGGAGCGIGMVRHRNPKGDWSTGGSVGGEPEPAEICSTTGKRMYGSEEEARETARHQMEKTTGLRLRVYRCLYCDTWHLTSKAE